MKIKVLLDSLLSKNEIEIHSHPENKDISLKLKRFVEGENKIALINASNNRNVNIPLSQVLCFQSEGNMCGVKTKDGEMYLINKRLKEIDAIGYSSFLKINNQTIINTNEIQEFVSASNARLMVTLKDNSNFYVNRFYVKSLKEILKW